MQKITKAVIPAAGLGTRFLPATKAMPKEMLPIVDKPALQYIVEEIVASGIREILIITGRNKRSIEDHFDKAVELEDQLRRTNKLDFVKIVDDITYLADNIYYVRQRETKGSGHAILCARAFVGDQPFAVLNGDDVVYAPGKPCLKQLLEAYERTGKSVLGVQTVPHSQISKYGAVAWSKKEGRLFEVTDVVEKPAPDQAPSDVAVLGRYVVTPDIFGYLETQTPGAGGEIQFTDSLRRLCHDKGMAAYEFEGRRYDIGDKQGYLEATSEYALRDPHLSAGFASYLKTLTKDL